MNPFLLNSFLRLFVLLSVNYKQYISCTDKGPGTHECACMEGYTGDGNTCLGNVMQEIQLSPELLQIRKWMLKWSSIREVFANVSLSRYCYYSCPVKLGLAGMMHDLAD